MDVTLLRAAYAEWLAEAGVHRPSALDPAGWTRQLVIAHVLSNDALIASTLRAILDRRPVPYDNASAVDRAKLASVARTLGEDGLLAIARGNASVVLDLARRVDGQAAIPHVRIRDGHTLQVDGPLAVGRFLGVQSAAHLPLHTRQLRELGDLAADGAAGGGRHDDGEQEERAEVT